MDFSKFIRNNLLSVKVVPQSSREELVEENGKLKLYLHAAPEKGKANLALVKFFKKEFGLRVEIKFGLTGREKIIKILERLYPE